MYRDLTRFDDASIDALEQMMAQHGLAELRRRRRRLREVHLDIDTTVEPVFGEHEGARPGPNPRYHGRPSYHPVLARIAETNTCVGARLRPGDTAFGTAVADVNYTLPSATITSPHPRPHLSTPGSSCRPSKSSR